MRIGAFEFPEPMPELREPHALAMIRPWVDVGSVGSLTLRRLERHFGAQPLGMAEDYVESIIELFKHFRVSVYCRIGAMYDSVPHTRPIVVTGNPGSVEPRPGASSPLIQQRQSQYEGPTTILNTLSDAATQLGMGLMTFMVHLPHYAQLDE